MKINIINKKYHNTNHPIFQDVKLQLPKTGLILLIGKSGSGKTTLLNILARKDNDFIGSIESINDIETVYQDFCLFESLSILDNLKIVCDDDKRINELINKFKLDKHKNKRVSKLSNGQKRRTQIIRSLLSGVGILLLDEPTSALDYNSAKIIVKEIYDYSREHLVIVSTHDIDIFEDYYDCKLEIIDRGIIFTNINNHYKDPVNHKILAPHYKKQLLFALKYLKSRILEFLLLVICFSSIVTLGSYSIDVYNRIYNFEYTNNIFMNGYNLVTSNKTSIINDEFGNRYFARFRVNQINELILNNKDIIAIESMSDYSEFGTKIYPNTIDNGLVYTLSDKDYYNKTFGRITYDNGFSSRCEIVSRPYLYLGETTLESESILLNRVGVFDLVNNYNLPLLVGNYTNNPNDAVIPLNYADYLLKILGLDSYDELINRTLVYAVITADKTNDYYKLSKEKVDAYYNGEVVLNTDYENFIIHPKTVDITISGISKISLHSEYYALFFNSGYLNNAFINEYIANKEYYEPDYINIYLNPNSDYNSSLININDTVVCDGNTFARYSEAISNSNFFNANTVFLPFVIISILLSLLIYVIYLLSNRKRLIKEYQILKNYEYNQKYFNIIHNSLMMICVVVISFICSLIYHINVSTILLLSILLCVMIIIFESLLAYDKN